MTVDGHVNLLADALGANAAKFLQRRTDGFGPVLAVFDRVFYVKVSQHIFCVTQRNVDLGPLSVRTTASSQIPWQRRGVQVDQLVNIRNQRMDIAGKVNINLALAQVIVPETNSVSVAPKSLSNIHRELAQLELNTDGIIPALFDLDGRNSSPLMQVAYTLIEQARAWLMRDNSAVSPDWARSFIGLGPGLTPSGDDLIAGLMIGLRRLGHVAEAETLWRAVEPVLGERTNAISASLLRAAAEGQGSMALLGALERLVTGQNAAAKIAKLAKQGHSSGTDALGGILLALEAHQARTEMSH